MADRDRNKRVLLDLAKQPNNNRCADCGAPEPDWASYKLGIFVCLSCSGTHRNITQISRIKSLRLDYWEDDVVEFMKANGNDVIRTIYERAVPVFFYRPQQNDCAVLRDQWIRAKYERREFTGENSRPQPAYCSGFYEGTLWKKGKNGRQFLKKKFVLSGKDFTLKYFTREDESKGPEAVIAVQDLNAFFQPEKMGQPHGLQISYLQDERARNLFVYHDSGQEIVSWFNAIRAVRFSYLKTAFPTATDEELIPQITRSNLKEGYMEKTGPMQWERYKRRWFVLDSTDRKLLYFKTPLDAVELGSVFLGSDSQGYSAREWQLRGRSWGNEWQFGLAVETPDRRFVFMCAQELDQREWLEAFRLVIAQPVTPQHCSTEANMKRRK